jgi:hypothetical protein
MIIKKIIGYIFFGLIVIIFRIGLDDKSFEEYENKIEKLSKDKKYKKFFELHYLNIENKLKESIKKSSNAAIKIFCLSIFMVLLEFIKIESINLFGIQIKDFALIKITLPVVVYFYMFYYMHLHIYQNDLEAIYNVLTRIFYPKLFEIKFHEIVKPFFLFEQTSRPFSSNFIGFIFMFFNSIFFMLLFAGTGLFGALIIFDNLKTIFDLPKYNSLLNISKIVFYFILFNLLALVTHYSYRHGYYRHKLKTKKSKKGDGDTH